MACPNATKWQSPCTPLCIKISMCTKNSTFHTKVWKLLNFKVLMKKIENYFFFSFGCGNSTGHANYTLKYHGVIQGSKVNDKLGSLEFLVRECMWMVVKLNVNACWNLRVLGEWGVLELLFRAQISTIWGILKCICKCDFGIGE